MLTNNFYKLMGAWAMGGGCSTLVDKTGAVVNIDAKHFPTSCLTNLTAFTSTIGQVFGTGTTPPTVDDYCVSGSEITNLTFTKTVTYGAGTVTCTYVITNGNSDPVTIGEVALFTPGSFTLYYNYSSGSNKTTFYKTVMLERTVLDTPVTIPAGGIGQVTYTIRMNYPTA